MVLKATNDRSVVRLLVGIASLIVAIAGIKALSGLLGPILLSLFLVLVCMPVRSWLKRKGWPDWLAYTAVVLGVIAIGFIFIVFLGVSLTQLSAAVPTYRGLVEDRMTDLEQFLDKYGLEGRDIFKLDFLSPTKLIQYVLSFLSSLLGTLSNVGLTLLIFVYMLASAPNFASRLQQGLGEGNLMLARCNAFAKSISVYLLIKSWLGAMTAISQILLMWLLGVDFAVLWGVFSFLFNFIPNIGFLIAIIPPVLLALVTLGLTKAIILAVVYTLINNFFDMAIAPRYLGKGLDLSTIVTFLAVILWAWILGPIGAFLALPLTVMIKKLLLEPFPDTQLLATLMSSGEEVQTPMPESVQPSESV